MIKYTLRKMIADDLEDVLHWRNHPYVRDNMFHQHKILMKEHREWYHRANLEPGRHLLIFEVDDISLGFVNLEFIEKNRLINWGFYKKYDAPKGIGREMGLKVIDYAFKEIQAHKIVGQVLAFNISSLNLHKSLGFSQEGILKEHFFDGKTYQDIVMFGLLARNASFMGS